MLREASPRAFGKKKMVGQSRSKAEYSPNIRSEE
jgi:hypothetical protein